MKQIVRKPRSWLTLWTYREDDHVIAQRLESEIKSKFLGELKEIYVPKLMTGYIFLRVVTPSQDFLDAVKHISGVGGILHLASKSPLEIIKSQFNSFFTTEEVFKMGDLVKVAIGPLTGCQGRVTEVGQFVKVELGVFGKLIHFDFQHNEVCLYKDAVDDGV